MPGLLELAVQEPHGVRGIKIKYLEIAVQDFLDGFFLFRGKGTVTVEQGFFFKADSGVTIFCRRELAVCPSYEKVDGYMEVIRDTGKCRNIRLNVVIFVFVNGLLADTDRISKRFLRNSSSGAKKF